MKSDKTPCIIYADLESLIKKLATVKVIQKSFQQQKQVNIFVVDIQCQLYRSLIPQKISMVSIAVKIV